MLCQNVIFNLWPQMLFHSTFSPWLKGTLAQWKRRALHALVNVCYTFFNWWLTSDILDELEITLDRTSLNMSPPQSRQNGVGHALDSPGVFFHVCWWTANDFLFIYPISTFTYYLLFICLFYFLEFFNFLISLYVWNTSPDSYHLIWSPSGWGYSCSWWVTTILLLSTTFFYFILHSFLLSLPLHNVAILQLKFTYANDSSHALRHLLNCGMYCTIVRTCKIGLSHTHPIVMHVTCQIWGLIPLIGNLVAATPFTTNLISLE
jgi:hypothetical protein